MSLEFHIGQLRHAYKLLKMEQVKDQKVFADGLIAPVIEALEKLNEGK